MPRIVTIRIREGISPLFLLDIYNKVRILRDMVEFVFFEESWNENKKQDRTGEVLDGGASPTCETSDDTKRPRR